MEPFRGYGGSFPRFGGNIIELNIVIKGAIVIITIGTMLNESLPPLISLL